MLDLKKIESQIEAAIEARYQQPLPVVLERPEDTYGDYTTTVAFRLARLVRQSPLEVAQAIAADLSALKLEGIERVEAVAPGYLNFFLDPVTVARETLPLIATEADAFGRNQIGQGKKVLLEHTSVNPNKSMHIGHIRNAILGDSLARLLRFCGYTVEVQNYIDDTGSQVADTVTGLLSLGREQPADQPYDEFCWDVYAEINRAYDSSTSVSEALVEKKKEVIHALEQGEGEIAKFAQGVVDRIVRCHLEQLATFGVNYELLVYESDILQVGLWENVFEQLKRSPNFFLATEGEHQGCWVLRNASGEEKVFVRSNGTKVYTAKDTAYHLWKFGLAGRDFQYQALPEPVAGKAVWRTVVKGESKKTFGHGDIVITLVDERQSYPMAVVKAALADLGFAEAAAAFHPFTYGVVMLSSATAAALDLPVEAGKQTYTMSGRKGIGVKVSDITRLLIEKIEHLSVDTELAAGRAKQQQRTIVGEQPAPTLEIAIGAIRFYMLAVTAPSSVTFDYTEALQLSGKTGPYLQYSYTRAAGIIRKALQSDSLRPGSGQAESFTPVFEKGEALTSTEVDLIKALARWPVVVEEAAIALALTPIADYAFELSAKLHRFYEENPVLQAEPGVRAFRLTLTKAYQEVIRSVLSILGITPLERM